MTEGIYQTIKRDAFHAGMLLVMTLNTIAASVGLGLRGETWWSVSAGAFALFFLLAFLRTYPRSKVVTMRPNETMVEFLERIKNRNEAGREIVEKDDDAHP